ncbi:hypothetical protein ACVW0P_002591 [Mucilaginibacter sp. UYNi724]
MKKTICLMALFGLANYASAQNSNPWPTTGNVGIGTISPASPLEVYKQFPSGSSGTGLKVTANGSGSSNGTTIYGAQIVAATAPASGSTQTIYGLDVSASGLGTGPSPVIGINSNTILSRLSGSTTTSYFGGRFIITGETGASTASNISSYGLYGEVANTTAGGEISNSYGVYGKATTVNTATAYGGYFTASGGATNYAVYSAAGTNYFNDVVGIGTTTLPIGYKLAVNGNVIATSVTVKVYNQWPDYVFHKSYNLPPLTEVKEYIDKNHHLPEMPSAAQVEKDGLNLGETNKLLTKKVEELTLYLIEQNKRIEKLEAAEKKKKRL